MLNAVFSACEYINQSIESIEFNECENFLYIPFSCRQFHFVVISCVECGLFGRTSSGGGQRGVQYDRMGYNAAGSSQYSNYNYNSNANNNNQNVNSNTANRRNAYINQIDQTQPMNKSSFSRSGSGLSAWGLITIIMLIIIIGMGGYYGILCYPLICKEERNYDIMDAASTTASANTPTRSENFEKSGNYSSRSTTPSVIINT